MRIAILGCIHANLPALEAVLADAQAQGADRVVCAGDLVGWGPQPREVLTLMRSRGIPSIRGHDDRRVVDLALDRDRGDGHGGPRTVRWTLDRLDDENLRQLSGLPLSYGFAAVGRTVVLVHGTPRDEDESLPPDAPARRLEAFLVLAGADVLACAHGHRPFVRELDGGRLVVNAGSVGRSFDGDPRASYVLLELDPTRAPHAQVLRVVYDIRAALEAAEHAGAPRRVQEELRARLTAQERGAEACTLVVTAPFRGSRSLRKLASDALHGAARALREAARQEDNPTEATHDARVATRRAIAALDIFAGLVKGPLATRAERWLEDVRRRLGFARDADVAAELLASLTSEEPGSPGAIVARDAVGRMRHHAERDRERGLALAGDKALHAALVSLAQEAASGRPRRVSERLAEIAGDARRALDRALADEGGREELHAFRIASKRLRYALEALAPLDTAAEALGAALADVQDQIGDARDRANLADRLDEEAARLAAESRLALAEAVRALAGRFREDALEREAAFKSAGPSARVRAAIGIGSEGAELSTASGSPSP